MCNLTMHQTPHESSNADDLGLTITTAHLDGTTTVAVAGEVDMANADQLSSAGLFAVTTPPRALVVDLTAVTFMDSSGLVHLARILRAARPATTRVLICGPRLATLFRVTGMASLCTVEEVA